MWKCPVCDQECETKLCPTCGFDYSQHYEQFPTLTSLSAPHNTVSAAKTAYEMTLGLPTCPVCGKSTNSLLCQHCGFDGSGNFEEHLTLNPVPRITPSISRRRKELAMQNLRSLTCTKCGGTTFAWNFDHPPIGWTCTECNTNIPHDEISKQQVKFHYAQMLSLDNPQRFIAAGSKHAVVLHLDGTVTAFGSNEHDQCKTNDWKNVVAVVAGETHTVGLRFDGTVIATGSNGNHQCDVSDWTDIVAIAAGNLHTVGLQKNGTIVTTSLDISNPCDVEKLSSAVSVFAGHNMFGTIHADGTVQTICKNSNRKKWLSSQRNVKSLWCTGQYIAVLHTNGHISLQYSDNYSFLAYAMNWSKITAVAVSKNYLVGLCSNGTVKSICKPNTNTHDFHAWNHIFAIAAGDQFTLGLQKNGNIIATGKINIPDGLSILCNQSSR